MIRKVYLIGDNIDIIINDDIPFSGNLIPGSIVAKVKPGKKVAIEVFYTLNGVRASTPVQGILTVTN